MGDFFEPGFIIVTFVLAGMVKGVVGLGLPTVSLALITVVIDLPTAMAFMLLAGAMVWVGAGVLNRVSLDWLASLLGLLLAIYSLTSLMGRSFSLDQRRQRWVGPAAGAFNGVLTGMTGSFVVPGVLYLQSVGFNRDQLIQAMGMLFTISTVALAISLQSNGLLSGELGLASILAVIPAIAGMAFGVRIRKILSEQGFRNVFFVSLLVLGGVILFVNFPGFG